MLNAQSNGASSSAGIDLSKTFPSPEVASLGTFGLIPANPFTGQANISIPLYEISYKDLKVPVSLSYSTSGNRPDEHPGWTGHGWSLSAGGIIYRKVNGVYDENDRSLGNGGQYHDDVGYYYNAGRLPLSYRNLDTLKKVARESMTSDDIAKYRYDTSPDEFIFNFNGYSGVFYFYRATHLGPLELRIRSNGDYRLKAEVLEFKPSLEFDDYYILGKWRKRTTGKAVYSFKITDEKGVQYIFGGTSTSLEFSNSGSLNTGVNANIPSTWRLTEIKAPAGYSIRFEYERRGRNFLQYKQRNALAYEFASSWWGVGTLFMTPFGSSFKTTTTSNAELINISVQNPVYLTKIVTPIQTISFKSSKSNELRYDFDNAAKIALLSPPGLGDEADSSCWQKLDEIEVGKLKKIKFNYINNPTRRLQLTGIDVQTLYDKTLQHYTFTYNSMLLPVYNSKKADHWGFYNGRSYAYDNNYLVTREPDSAYLRAEMLQKITYPTGGYTWLEYEPHFYRKVSKQLPFIVETKTSNLLAGGLRIRKIVSTPDANIAPITKEYFYITDYMNGGTASSGVLAGSPQYVNFGTASNQFRTENFLNPGTWTSSGSYAKILDNNYLKLSTTNGNHITYSEVTEKSGGGYTVHKYSNLDNGYQDKAPFIVYTNFDQTWPEEGFISMESFRGLELSNGVYNNERKILKESIYTYDIDTVNTDYQVPYIYRILDGIGGYSLSRVSSCVFYTKPALVKKITERTYVPGSATNFLSIETENQYFPNLQLTIASRYDNYKKASEKIINSEGDTLKATYSYPYNKIATGEDGTGIYKAMADSNINAIVLKQAQFKNSVRLKTDNMEYYRPDSKLFRPKLGQVQQGDGPLETEIVYDSYDQYGNILQETGKGSLPVSYLWDYNGEYPIAGVINAIQQDIAYTSFEAEGKGGWIYNGTPVKSENFLSGKKCLNIGGSGNLLVYLSKGGLTSTKRYTVSYWSRNGSYNVTGSITSKTGRSYNGWTYYEHIVANSTATDITGTGYIDEVRLYPEDAQIMTYTYEPLKGMTSQCDSKGAFLYYEYDSFGRLHVVRNQNGHIIKLICYNYAGEQEVCNEQLFYNTEIKDSITRNCGTDLVGNKVVYIVPAEKYVSNISVEDANNKARAEIELEGPAYANAHGSCFWGNDEQKLTAARECPAGYFGSNATYIVAKNAYLSPVSREDANAQAMVDITTNYRNYVNTHGTCALCNVLFSRKAGSGDLGTLNIVITNTSTGVIEFSKTFTDPTDAALAACLSLPSGSYSAKVSSMDKALYVTVDGTERLIPGGSSFTWLFTSGSGIRFLFSTIPAPVLSSKAISATYRKSNCIGDSTGSLVTYNVAAGKYTSSVQTQGYLDTLAQQFADANGPAYANANGYCTPVGVNLSVRFKNGGKSISSFYTIKIKNGSTTVATITDDASLPVFRTIAQGTYTVELSSMGGIIFNVGGSDRTVNNSTVTISATTPIEIFMSGL